MFTAARELARLLRTREISAHEVMAAHLAAINRLNPKLNAVVARLDDEACLAAADEADRRLTSRDEIGPLHGLPFAFKDLEPVRGFRWTRGSRIFERAVADADSVLVARLRSAGVIPIGKTNVPEFGMGSHTYNQVYGTTRNPYDLTKSAGGSSGGAAAAVAAGLLPCADGSDLGGSLRNPGSFNNVVGFRPTFGLVPVEPSPFPTIGFGVKGPIARSVDDAAFLLGAMAGEAAPPGCAEGLEACRRHFSGTPVAWCLDLGGLPLDGRVRRVLERHRATFEKLGCAVDDACPDLSLADCVFLTIRQWMSAQTHGPLLERHRSLMKPEAVWEIEAGRRVSQDDLARAFVRHGQLLDAVSRFQQRYEFLVCTVNQVPPFDAELDWVKEIDGVPMEHYVAWMKSTYWISATLCPSISIPAGFTDDGRPVGIQIVGRKGDDAGVLQIAYAFELATGVGRQRPAVCR